MNKKQEIDVFSVCLVFMYHREELYMTIAGYHIAFVGQSKRTVELQTETYLSDRSSLVSQVPQKGFTAHKIQPQSLLLLSRFRTLKKRDGIKYVYFIPSSNDT